MIPTWWPVTLSALLFSIGLFGLLSRRNAIAILMCIELMLNAANINLVAFSRAVTAQLLTGQVFAIFVMAIAAAEAAVGLAIVIALYRNRERIVVDEVDLLRW
ncbi:MAG: NADH-quinone oxidoreductase subunit K [Armatimonadota bacterium]|nr:MAG: NADH-quinone oxidoreductase subunit K [Armatimonadota bacterium]